MWSLLGRTRIASGDLPAAAHAHDEELANLLGIGHETLVAFALGNCAEVAIRRGDLGAAASHQLACLEVGMALGQPLAIVSSLILAARLAGVAGDFDVAARLQAGGDVMLEEIGFVLFEHDRQLSDHLLAEARKCLGDKTFLDEVAAGRGLEPDKAAALAADVLRSAVDG